MDRQMDRGATVWWGFQAAQAPAPEIDNMGASLKRLSPYDRGGNPFLVLLRLREVDSKNVQPGSLTGRQEAGRGWGGLTHL